MKNDDLERINYKGCTIRIVQDESDMNPRTEFDNVGILVTWRRNYSIGEVNGKEYGDPRDFMAAIAGIDTESELTDQEIRERAEKKNVILPVYMYDHSGITISTGNFKKFDPQGWDSGCIGFIYCTNARAKKEWKGRKWREKALNYLNGEIETMDQYLTGRVYGFIAEDNAGDMIDSCFGYFGDYEKSDLMDTAKGSIDFFIAKTIKKQIAKVKAYIQNHVPLDKREAFSLI